MTTSLEAVGLTFVVYLAAMLAIGLYSYRRTRDLADYILGGRRLGKWVTALSAEASDMSGWLLLGLPGYAYASGLDGGWIALGLLVGTYLNWRLVAARLRHYSLAAGDALTLPDFFEQRFADQSRVLRVVAAAFILLFFTFYTGSGLVAGGKLFNAVFGIDYTWAVALGGLMILMYTLLGGFLAVSWTDLVQGLLMVFALAIAPVAAIEALGGWSQTLALLQAHNASLLDPLRDRHGHPLGTVAIASLLGWGLGYFGQPHILARFMAIGDPAQLPQARRIAVGWVAVSLVGALLVGLIGVVYLAHPLQGAATERVFMNLVQLVFHPLVAGAMLAAILAAIMSTADSQLLVASSALAEDFYKALWRREAGRRELIWVGRGAVLLIAVVAFLLAMTPGNKVLDLVAYAWAGFGAAFGPTVLFALFWRRMTRNGALAGIVLGGLTVIVWKQLHGGLFDLYEIIPGFVASCAAIVIASLLDAPPPSAVTTRFDAVAAESD
ncbi:MAG TPA: sodium/proline symporter PutP [Gammaproteobacteria bacterium]|nr:sodium/proline symporter PutP [Gammaproteobacteria bacterium]